MSDGGGRLSARGHRLPPRAGRPTIPEQAPQQIELLRLDIDWYESTRYELEDLYDRLPSRTSC
ncbi:MAG: TylF/MycF family methyltransferase [Chloroflexota bacterium]|nr:TylF/MycF family methyltransferase [Chloroflexota bacterium]